MSACEPVAILGRDINDDLDAASAYADADADSDTLAPDRVMADMDSSDNAVAWDATAVADNQSADLRVADTRLPDTRLPDLYVADTRINDLRVADVHVVSSAANFSARDINPNSPSYEQQRSMSDTLGKVMLVYFVSFS